MREAILQYWGNKPLIKIDLGELAQHCEVSRKFGIGHIVKVEKRDPEELRKILSEIYPKIGLPSFVEAGSDYAAVERALEPYNKRLTNFDLEMFFSLSPGKRVIETRKETNSLRPFLLTY